jgi:hypothetical protein
MSLTKVSKYFAILIGSIVLTNYVAKGINQYYNRKKIDYHIARIENIIPEENYNIEHIESLKRFTRQMEKNLYKDYKLKTNNIDPYSLEVNTKIYSNKQYGAILNYNGRKIELIEINGLPATKRSIDEVIDGAQNVIENLFDAQSYD